MTSIDLNCDMGEGCGNDEVLLNYVSSANIACGFHAGDDTSMRATAKAAFAKDVAVGAHPSFRDRENFGRTEMELSPTEVREIVGEQVAKMKSVCESLGGRLNHVKPHGALYNMAARDAKLAQVIAETVHEIDDGIILYGLSGSYLISEARKTGLRTASEAFADRTYTAEGRLTPRTEHNALIDATDTAIRQVLQIVETGRVTSTNETLVPLLAETVCIHGDGAHAVEFAIALRAALAGQHIQVRPITK